MCYTNQENISLDFIYNLIDKKAMYAAIFAIILVLMPQSGSAVVRRPTPKTVAQSSTQNQEQFSLDILEQSLHSSHPGKKGTFAQAERSLTHQNWRELQLHSSRWIAEGKLSDVGYWLRAQAKRGLAAQALEHHRASEALKLTQEAIQALVKIFEGYPTSPYARTLVRDLGEVELLQGDALFQLKKISAAQAVFEKSFQRLQSQNLLWTVQPSVLEHYSVSCSKHPSVWCRSWADRFVRVFSKKSNEVQVLSRTFPGWGEGGEEIKKVSPSTPRVSASYKATDLDAVAYQEAIQYYWKGRYSQSTRAFKKFLDDYPKSSLKPRALYWWGRGLERQGDRVEAGKVYESLQQSFGLSFHGLLSSIRIQRGVDEVASALIPLGAENDPALTVLEGVSLKRAVDLIRAHALTLAAQELKELKPRENLSTAFLLYLVLLQSRVGNSLQAFQGISELIQRAAPEVYSSFVIRRIFPTPYLDPIETFAAQMGLDPLLILSLIKQESSFDAQATSWVGAMGLMQLMPGTAVETDPKVILSTLRKPQENIRVGTLYLKKLLDRYAGNVILALAAYNAGPAAVDRWLKNSPHQDLEEFIEYIPYKETRDYVSSIIRNYFWYSHYLKGAFPQGVEMFWTGMPNSKHEAQSKPGAT